MSHEINETEEAPSSLVEAFRIRLSGSCEGREQG